MPALIIDCETNCIASPEPIEVAIQVIQDDFVMLPVECRRFKPTGQMGVGAVATHHILPSELDNCPPTDEAKAWVRSIIQSENIQFVIGHNVDFDAEVLDLMHMPRICTLALARESWPNLESHRLGAIIYHMKGFTEAARAQLKNAHGADCDVECCLDVLLVVCQRMGLTSLADAWRASETARIPKIMAFGKHKGLAITDVPVDYCQWMLRQDDVDQYLRIAMERRIQGAKR